MVISEYHKKFHRLLKKFNPCETDELNFTKIFTEFNYITRNKFLSNDDLSQINKLSFINFLRYFPYIISQFDKVDCFILEKKITIKIMNSKKTSLTLTFNSDGSTDFISTDNDSIEPNEKKIYIIKGEISTSNILIKSEKINRLLQIILFEDKKEINKNDLKQNFDPIDYTDIINHPIKPVQFIKSIDNLKKNEFENKQDCMIVNRLL